MAIVRRGGGERGASLVEFAILLPVFMMLVLGMFSFAYVEELTGSMRNSVLALMTFFFIGMLLLIWTLRTKQATLAKT